MPLLTRVGRKTPKARLLIAGLYIILTLGGLSMLYPFGLMLSTSICGKVDYLDYKLVPAYLKDDTVLFRRYLAEKSEKISLIATEYAEPQWYQFKDIVPPAWNPKWSRIGQDWDTFRTQLPSDLKFAYFHHLEHPDNYLYSLSKVYQRWLEARFDGDIEKLNLAYLQTAEKFTQVLPPHEDPSVHKWHPKEDPKTMDWLSFKETLPAEYVRVVSINHTFGSFLRRKYETVEACNEALGTGFPTLYHARFEQRPPDDPRYRQVWEEFVRHWCPVIYLELDSAQGQPLFERFLQKKYASTRVYNESHEDCQISSFSQVTLTRLVPRKESLAADWAEFVEGAAPLSIIGFRTPDKMYRDFLQARYGDLDALNRAYGTSYISPEEIALPYREADSAFFEANKSKLRRSFVAVNYRAAFNFMVVHGRAALNTLVLVVAIILTALTVNPLAAYALSRFNLSYTPRILLFLLATMAFPAEVVMIPNFLLIKELHLLNTYWALILPSMANAYTIFILKGFFDSLPRELYEEAIINGASEGYMFLHITIPMSKPVLAVVSLWAFLAAYGAYMWAFLICQEEKMWTLMVYLFQFQMRNPPYAVMAAIALIAIPTLLVFVLTQRIILRGIITPSFT